MPQRVEGDGPVDELVDRRELRRQHREIPDAPGARRAGRREAEIDDHEAGESLAVRLRVAQGVQRAQRLADEHEAIELEVFDPGFDVSEVRGRAVVESGRPLAVAVAALVERQAVVRRPQRRTGQIPGMRGQETAVKEEHGEAAGRPPVEIVQPQPAPDEMSVLGQREIRHRHPGNVRRRP
jgi:hypothetical protein